MGKKEYVSWNIPVPFVLDQAVEDAVKSGQFISKSDFVRYACRKELASISVERHTILPS